MHVSIFTQFSLIFHWLPLFFFIHPGKAQILIMIKLCYAILYSDIHFQHYFYSKLIRKINKWTVNIFIFFVPHFKLMYSRSFEHLYIIWLKCKYDYDKDTSLPTICPAEERTNYNYLSLTPIICYHSWYKKTNKHKQKKNTLSFIWYYSGLSFLQMRNAANSYLWHDYHSCLPSFCMMPAATGGGKV